MSDLDWFLQILVVGCCGLLFGRVGLAGSLAGAFTVALIFSDLFK